MPRLYVYDLSGGLVQKISSILLPGNEIEGIWHSSIVVFGSLTGVRNAKQGANPRALLQATSTFSALAVA